MLVVAFDARFQMLGACLSCGLLTMQCALLIYRICVDDRASSSIRHGDAGSIVRMYVPHERNFRPSGFLIYGRARDYVIRLILVGNRH